ncbi:ABC transporter substrate-binding protein [Desulfococcaceae bacterium HSG9]|nr:ABC transporter substrate-binding protein [Desulfococcaceae bacterium HSG9]
MKNVKQFMFTAVLFIMLSGTAAAQEKLTLMLDWFPNVDHLPIYVAQQTGMFADQGLKVNIISPSGTSDALKLAAAGETDIAVSYQPQTIIAASQGIKIMAIGRLVAHPLTTLLFLKDKGIKTPRDLTGKRIGYTVPGLMDVLLAAFAKLNHIENYTAVNVGFTIVQSLSADKVDAVMGPFKTYETVTMAQKGISAKYFELEKYGIPDYDELVFVSSPTILEKKQKTLAKFIDVIGKAMKLMHADTEKALADYLKAVPEADSKIETAAFKLTLPYYAKTQQFDNRRWQTFADFALKYGLIEKAVDTQTIIWKKAR